MQVAWHTCKTQFYSADQKKFHIPIQRLPSGSACQWRPFQKLGTGGGRNSLPNHRLKIADAVQTALLWTSFWQAALQLPESFKPKYRKSLKLSTVSSAFNLTIPCCVVSISASSTVQVAYSGFKVRRFLTWTVVETGAVNPWSLQSSKQWGGLWSKTEMLRWRFPADWEMQ